MNETLGLVLDCVAGGILGVIFFGGLWWTVRQGVLSRRPALWFFSSLLLRMGIVLTGFYFVPGHDWARLVACLLGFVLARFAVIWLTRLLEEQQIYAATEASHAP